VAPRRRPRGRPLGSQHAQLATKLDGLAVMLTRQQQAAQDVEVELEVGGPTPFSVAAADERVHGGCSSFPVLRADERMTPSGGQVASASACGTMVLPHDYLLDRLLSHEVAESYLVEFRTQRAPLFPALSLAPTTTAAHLAYKRPFLWSCILALGTRSMKRKAEMLQQIRQHVVQKLVVEHEHGRDLLLGQVLCLAWANLGANHRADLNMNTQLGMYHCLALGLNRTPRARAADRDAVYRFTVPVEAVCARRTTEEMRAVLAMWFLACK
jgi:hypothetical protein